MKENPAQMRSSRFWRPVIGLVKKKLGRGKTWARLKFLWLMLSMVRTLVWVFKNAQALANFIGDHFG
jgi:hypothetical protein